MAVALRPVAAIISYAAYSLMSGRCWSVKNLAVAHHVIGDDTLPA